MCIRDRISTQLKRHYLNYSDKELGIIVAVLDILKVGEGIIIPGDGAAFYKCNFTLLSYIPELQEMVYGELKEITSFGAFMNIGAIDGMIHVSQTMDDFVSFAKSNTLVGKNKKRVLKKGDLCIARIIAISYKGSQPKIGLTMRQPGLGKIEWIAEDKKKAKNKALTGAKAKTKKLRK